MRLCSVEDCEKPHLARGLCAMHRARLVRAGLLPPLVHPSLMVRFWSKVDIAPGCWEWLGARDPAGYGRFRVPPRTVLAYRWLYEHLFGPVPTGLTLDHRCDNKGCVRPDHLRPTSHWENNRRGNSVAARNARKTHCVHGHPYTPETTGFDRGWRYCRTCHVGKAGT